MAKPSPRGAQRPRRLEAPQSSLRYEVQVLAAQAHESDLEAIHAFLVGLYAQHAAATTLVAFTAGGG